MLKAILKIVFIPLILACVDVYLRSSLLALYSTKQLAFYFFSVLLSISYFILVSLFLKRISANKYSFYLFAILLLSPLLLSFIASYAYFLLNGIFPNYYTLLYFKTEPKSAMMIVRDVAGWREVIFFGLFLALVLFGMRWFVKKQIPEIKRSNLLIYLGIQFIAFQFLVYHHKKFDQCAMVDTNFAACFQRHLFTWDDHSEFKGKGLACHKAYPFSSSAPDQKVNVLVVVFESCRKNSMQIYGHDRKTTPYLSKFASENSNDFYTFQQAVSVSTTTMLAVPAILTGIGPYQDSSVLYQQPFIWDYAKMANASTFFLSSHTLKWYRFDRFYQKAKLDLWWNKDNSGLPFYNDLGIRDAATIQKLNKTLSLQKDRNFMGVVQLNTTHYPYKIPQEYLKWKDTYASSYDNAMVYQDFLIGKMLKQLKAQKILDNTAVFFVSDHGESLMEHKSIGHVENNYTETIGIPMMAYIPSKLLSKKQIKALRYNTKQLTSNVDLAPTLVDLLGLKNEKEVLPYLSNFTGFSLLQAIESDRKVISLNNNQIASFNTGISIAHKDWHYLYRTNIVPNQEELYFWKKDLGEWHNEINSLSKSKRQGIINFISSYPVCSKFIMLMSAK